MWADASYSWIDVFEDIQVYSSTSVFRVLMWLSHLAFGSYTQHTFLSISMRVRVTVLRLPSRIRVQLNSIPLQSSNWDTHGMSRRSAHLF